MAGMVARCARAEARWVLDPLVARRANSRPPISLTNVNRSPVLARARRIPALLAPSSLRAAAWALMALRRTRRDLAAHGLEGARVTPPPRLPAAARVGVLAVVRRRPSTCLERALVLQR